MSESEDSYDKLFEDLLRESARAAADFDADEAMLQIVLLCFMCCSLFIKTPTHKTNR